MDIRAASAEDYTFLLENDRHIRPGELRLSLEQGRVLLIRRGAERIGWLRWNLFWDNTPFMNLLYILEEHRKEGFGGQLMACWEQQMGAAGHKLVMTSTRSDEQAQHFYRKAGYVDCGSLLRPGEPLEILFRKDTGT